jgi:phosphoesterase RecJ-like protein
MISRIIKETTAKDLLRLINNSEHIVITCHLSPDGDAVGSSLGLWHVLNALGKHVYVVTPDMLPRNMLFLPGAKDVLPFTRYTERGEQLLSSADLIFCLDFNDPSRVDKMSASLLASKARKVLIDHHLFPADFADITISHPEMSSTCYLLFKVLCALGLYNRIDKNAAECIYTGMMTDTGNFSYNSNDSELYIVISELLKKGINKDKIYQQACNTHTASRIRLNGYAVYKRMQLFPEHQAALITLTADELKEFDYEKGDTESLVNVPLGIPDITYSMFLRDDGDYIKVSMRSKGEFAVNKICEDHFNGGGHRNAAGGEFYGTLAEAMDKFTSIMNDYDSLLPSKTITKQ